jgi:hypothetical protein
MKKNIKILFIAFIAITFFSSCKKESSTNLPPTPIDTTGGGGGGGGTNTVLNYGDTIFFLQPSGNNLVTLKNFTKVGRFYAFPKGIELDSTTGTIDLKESEMGLRYKIMFVPAGTRDTIKTKIVLAGINFYDGIYKLSLGDTIAHSIYNANSPFIPGQIGTGLSNTFDEGNGCNSQGCAVSTINGKINLAKSIRDAAIPKINDAQKEFTYFYRIDDRSGKSLNKLKVILYYYDSVADIPQYLWDILLIDHAGTIIPAGLVPLNSTASTTLGTLGIAKPRPPCVIIVDH